MARSSAGRTPPGPAHPDRRPDGGEGPETFVVDVAPRRLLRWLLGVIATLLVASLLGQVLLREAPDFPFRGGLAHALYVDSEQSLPTIFAVAMMAAAAGLLAVVAVSASRAGAPDRRYWIAAAALVGVATLDEYLSLHEQLIEPMRDLLGEGASGVLHFAWVVPAVPFVALLAMLFGRFLLRLPTATRRCFLAAAVLFVAGALGMEMVGGAIEAAAGDRDGYAYLAATTVEEGLELVAVAILLYGLVNHIVTELGGAEVRVAMGAERDALGDEQRPQPRR